MRLALLLIFVLCTHGSSAFLFGNIISNLVDTGVNIIGGGLNVIGNVFGGAVDLALDATGNILDAAGNIVVKAADTMLGLGGNVVSTVVDPFHIWKDDSDTDHGHSIGAVTPCPAVADIVFVLDASGSVGVKNFAKQLDFANRLSEHFRIGPNDVQFGAVVFSSAAQKRFDLNTYRDHTSLSRAIKSIPYLSGGTKTYLALDMVLDQQMLTSAHGARSSSSKLVIVVTDGMSDSFSKTSAAAGRLKANNIDVIAVGIGLSGPIELNTIASGYYNVFSTHGFDTLYDIEQRVARRMCQIPTDAGFVPPPEPIAPVTCANGFQPNPSNNQQCIDIDECKFNPCDQNCKNYPGGYLCSCTEGWIVSEFNPLRCTKVETCTAAADVIVVVDSSGSIGDNNWALQMEFAAKLADSFAIGSSNMRMGSILFSDNVEWLFDLNTYSTASEIKNAFKRAPYLKQRTYTNKALDYIDQQGMFSSARGGRDGVEKVVIVITDGASTRRDLTQAAATRLKNKGITIISVGISASVDQEELTNMATSPTDVLYVQGFDLLGGLEGRLTSLTCRASKK